MIILDERVEESIINGQAKQVVLADADGFVLDNAGYVYDPDELVSIFISTQRQMQDGILGFDFGQISEFSFRMVGTDMTVACRRVFWADGGCLVIVVVPVGTFHNPIVSDVMRSYINYLERQRSALRNS